MPFPCLRYHAMKEGVSLGQRGRVTVVAAADHAGDRHARPHAGVHHVRVAVPDPGVREVQVAELVTLHSVGEASAEPTPS